jgi:hypothetical protein
MSSRLHNLNLRRATYSRFSPTSFAALGTSVRGAMTLALSLTVIALWAILHRYAGMDHDARIYAFQALSRLHPNYLTDLYLQNTSQDRFTIFSAFYAKFIELMGLENSALLLTEVFTAWFFIAAWFLIRRLGTYELAWVSVAAIAMTSGDYGAFGVFHFPETYLSARLPAYALVATSICLHLRDYRKLSFCVAAAALLVHPIMALPGLLLLLCLSISVRTACIGAAAGLLLTLTIAFTAIALPATTRYITLMDPAWLEVVQQRSQFLFIQFWSLGDLDMNARPFICLVLAAGVLTEVRERRLSIGALLVGTTGILVAFIGGGIGPVALLVQGQAWRWEWITCFVAVLLIPLTMYRLWPDKRCGPLCSLLLVAAWLFPVLDGTLFASLALLIWLGRNRITALNGRQLRWAAMALATVMVIWLLATSWNLLTSTTRESSRESVVLVRVTNVLGLGASAAFLFGALWYWVITRQQARPLLLLSTVLIASLSYVLPRSFSQLETVDSAKYLDEFADWRAAIPPDRTVLVTPAQDAGKFVWFSLQRPQYLSADQSAGVVFSRATALEVKRRSEVLLPIEQPDWKFMSAMSAMSANTVTGTKKEVTQRPVTAEQLSSVCQDPALGFVMTKEIAGVESLRRMERGKWKGWGLYDCQSRRATSINPF